jgi:Raf kinase inhibitor-like YbhB/YbcL family protein
MRLTSAAFQDGGDIPRNFTCDGEDRSPALAWAEAPNEAKSFLLLMDDLDAPGGVFHHWACYDIPADFAELAEDAGRPATSDILRHGVNDFRELGYNGPCPPHGHGVHRYRFRLFALNCVELPIDPRPRCAKVGEAAHKHVFAEARLIGRYGR